MSWQAWRKTPWKLGFDQNSFFKYWKPFPEVCIFDCNKKQNSRGRWIYPKFIPLFYLLLRVSGIFLTNEGAQLKARLFACVIIKQWNYLSCKKLKLKSSLKRPSLKYFKKIMLETARRLFQLSLPKVALGASPHSPLRGPVRRWISILAFLIQPTYSILWILRQLNTSQP